MELRNFSQLRSRLRVDPMMQARIDRHKEAMEKLLAQRVIIGKIVNIRKHPNADRLEVAEIDGHTIVTGAHYQEGQLGYFIPPGAIIPDAMAEDMWLKGKLDGPNKNIVRAREMRGIMSEGLFYGLGMGGKFDDPFWREGRDITDEVDITFENSGGGG